MKPSKTSPQILKSLEILKPCMPSKGDFVRFLDPSLHFKMGTLVDDAVVMKVEITILIEFRILIQPGKVVYAYTTPECIKFDAQNGWIIDDEDPMIDARRLREEQLKIKFMEKRVRELVKAEMKKKLSR